MSGCRQVKLDAASILRCSQCKVAFGSKYMLGQHNLQHHSTKQYPSLSLSSSSIASSSASYASSSDEAPSCQLSDDFQIDDSSCDGMEYRTPVASQDNREYLCAFADCRMECGADNYLEHYKIYHAPKNGDSIEYFPCDDEHGQKLCFSSAWAREEYRHRMNGTANVDAIELYVPIPLSTTQTPSPSSCPSIANRYHLHFNFKRPRNSSVRRTTTTTSSSSCRRSLVPDCAFYLKTSPNMPSVTAEYDTDRY